MLPSWIHPVECCTLLGCPIWKQPMSSALIWDLNPVKGAAWHVCYIISISPWKIMSSAQSEWKPCKLASQQICVCTHTHVIQHQYICFSQCLPQCMQHDDFYKGHTSISFIHSASCCKKAFLSPRLFITLLSACQKPSL